MLFKGVFMRKIFGCILLFILIGIFLSACSQQKTGNKSGIANPASTYCVEQGGKLEIMDSAEGQHGVCILPDGTECEEWKYFRKECPKTQSADSCREVGTDCCKGFGENISCINADVECTLGSEPKFFGCDLEKCMPKWDCVKA